MLEKIVDFVCGYEEIAFESEFDLDMSVRRLAAEVNPPLGGLRPLVTGSGVVAGKVSEQRVSLWSEDPILRYRRGATFIGYFRIVNNRVFLIGKLGPTRYVFVFFILVFGTSAVLTIEAISELTKEPRNLVLWATALFGGPTMILFMIGLVRVLKWLFSGNERWLLVAIRSALRPNH
jgi:hypothetical protein